MIFHRLTVSNFKGIRHMDVKLAPTGITLLEGRNEIGKSSLVQALVTLFNQPANRRRSTLEHLIPKDGSGTPVISLEAESGEYRFIYSKSYVENKTTKLTVVRPDESHYEGNEAQERLEKILNGTMDRTLWEALMLKQGMAVGLADVEAQQTLLAALDSAVAGSGRTPDSEGLFDRIAQECGRYYQSRHGGELKTLTDLRDDAAQAEAAVREAEGRLNDLEKKIAKGRQLRRDIQNLRERQTAEQRRWEETRKRLAEVEQLEKARDAEGAKRNHAEEVRARAERELANRKHLLGMIASSREHLDARLEAVRVARSAEAETTRAATEKRAVLDALGDEWLRSEKLAAVRRADYEYYHDKLELERLLERKNRIDVSLEQVAMANRELARNRITDKAAAEIQQADNAEALARARMEGAAPRLLLEALGSCTVMLDEAAENLEPGETRTVSVTKTASLKIPGLLALEIMPGDGGGELENQLRESQQRLRKLLAAYGATDVSDVPALLGKRRQAEQAVRDHKRIEAENLRDLPYSGGPGGLTERIRELTAAVPGYPAVRGEQAIAMSPDLDTARRERDAAESAHKIVIAGHREAKAAYDAVEALRQSAREELARLEAEAEGAKRDLERFNLLVAESRQGAADQELEEAFAKSEKNLADASLAVAVIETRLREMGADLIRDRLAGLEKALEKTELEATVAREDLARLEGELNHLGGNGLHEKLEELNSVLEHKNRLLKAEVRKAEAARLLYEVVSKARESSQQAYVRPLRRQIEDLAKSVYGREVRVVLDKDLQISSRTMDGMEIVFSELSGGAREQFSLIHRAACSLAVSKDGGVPLILDDALGYSDMERLMGMNEVLSRAAQKCQIILLTCMPNRYAYLEPAARVNLEELAAAALQ